MKTKLFLIAIALFFVSASLRADVTLGNFWLNPTFEAGTDPGMTTGTPAFWNRGGGDVTIDQWVQDNSVSATHSLAVIDNGGFYGEWYSDQSIAGLANPGTTIGLHWHEIFSIGVSNEMRVTVRFGALVGTNTFPSFGPDNHFVLTGGIGGTNSPGWTGSLTNSPFRERNETLVVPAGQTFLRIQLASGGPEIGTGQYIIDDLSVVPEPSTIALLSVGGLVGLSVLLRRRKIAR